MKILSVSHDPNTIARIFEENEKLKEINAGMLEALKEIVMCGAHPLGWMAAEGIAHAAIAKATP